MSLQQHGTVFIAVPKAVRYRQAIRKRERKWLLAHNVQVQWRQSPNDLCVRLVQSANEDTGNTMLAVAINCGGRPCRTSGGLPTQPVLPAHEFLTRPRQFIPPDVSFAKLSALEVIWFGNRGDGARCSDSDRPSIGVAPGPCSDDHEAGHRHLRPKKDGLIVLIGLFEYRSDKRSTTFKKAA